jgi:hypothetical protein
MLMIMLWFRPQGIIPERVRRFAMPAGELLNRDGHSVEAPAEVMASVHSTSFLDANETHEGSEA